MEDFNKIPNTGTFGNVIEQINKNFDIAKVGIEQKSEGKSAYEVAVDNGFEGTEEEWLASLKEISDYENLIVESRPENPQTKIIYGIPATDEQSWTEEFWDGEKWVVLRTHNEQMKPGLEYEVIGEVENYIVIPDGYERVDYIENTSDAYIETGIAGNLITRVKGSWARKGDISKSYQGIFGNYNGDENADKWRIIYDTVNPASILVNCGKKDVKTISINGSLDIVNTFDIKASSITINNVNYNYSSNSGNVNNTTLKIFRGKLDPPSLLGSINGDFVIYGANNTKLRNYIPVKNPSGEYGLYDTVSKSFFGSANNSKFIGGKING